MHVKSLVVPVWKILKLWVIVGRVSRTLGYLLAQQTVLLGQATDAVIGLSHHADGTADGVHLGRAGHGAGVRVHINQVQLHAGVVLGVDDTVARRAAKLKENKFCYRK